MLTENISITLASQSPRRKELLQKITTNFKVLKLDFEEVFFSNELPVKAVQRIANEKLLFASGKVASGIVITADTIVVFDNKILGKPKNKKDAYGMLNLLSGEKHFVYTGFGIINLETGKKIISYDKTIVEFQKLNNKLIKEYVASGLPMDKAGAYGIQDNFGSVFVKKINGCYYNVVGFPVSKIYNSLKSVL